MGNDRVYEIFGRTKEGQVEMKEDGLPLRLLGTVVDITEQKRTEERERRMKAEAIAATAKFRAVFNQTSAFAGVLSLDRKVLDANQLCLEFRGYSAEEILGRPFWETAGGRVLRNCNPSFARR